MFYSVKMRYTPLVAAILLALPLGGGASPAAAQSDSTMLNAIPLPPQPGQAVVAPATATPTTPAVATPTPAASAQPKRVGNDPMPGDSVTTALQVLGRPNGQFDMSNEVLYMFDRGTVMVAANGIVEEVNLTPLAKFQAQKAAEAQLQTEQQAAHVRANALLDLMLNDSVYQALPTRDRILALTKFDREHPGSDAPQDIKDLISIYQAEQAVQNHLANVDAKSKQAQNKSADLQQRLDADEKALAALRARTEKAEQQAAQAAAAQPPQVVTDPLVIGPTVVNQTGPQSKAGAGAVVITAGGVAEVPARPVIVNGTVKNSIANGTWVMQPDGTIKMIPAQTTN